MKPSENPKALEHVPWAREEAARCILMELLVECATQGAQALGPPAMG